MAAKPTRKRFRPAAGATPATRAQMRSVPRPRFAAAATTTPELKFHDVDVDDTTVAQGGTIQVAGSCLNIAQGVGEDERVGRRCTIRSIGWRFNINLPFAQDQADIPNGDVVRVILYLDRQANGAAAVTLDLLEEDNYQSFNNLSNKNRFRTLMDRTYTLNHHVASADGANTVSVPVREEVEDTFFKPCNIVVEYSGAAGAIGEIRSNNICVLLVGKTGVANFGSKMRFRFSDV